MLNILWSFGNYNMPSIPKSGISI